MKTTNPALIKSAVHHWEREAREARAEILRGDSPQWDKNRWSYISECRRFIRRLYANARTEGQ